MLLLFCAIYAEYADCKTMIFYQVISLVEQLSLVSSFFIDYCLIHFYLKILSSRYECFLDCARFIALIQEDTILFNSYFFIFEEFKIGIHYLHFDLILSFY